MAVRALAWIVFVPLCATAVRTALAQPAPSTFAAAARIIESRCVTCHRPGGDAPFSLATPAEMAQRASTIRDVVRRGYMPPWKPAPGVGEFEGDRRLRPEERQILESWTEISDAETVASSVAPSTVRSPWPLGPPDQIVTLEPYVLKADGADVFRNFVVNVPGPGLRFVRGMQFRPGGAAVHHANVRVDRTAASRALDAADPAPGYEGLILRSADFPDGHFLGWTPGQIEPALSDRLSWSLPAGADLVVQLHLRPTGRIETVAPAIGLYFTDRPSSERPTMIRLGRQDLAIPAGAQAHHVTDAVVLPVPVVVHAVQAHAHARATRVDAWATRPDGATTPLLRILDWDVRWQDRYLFRVPVALPAGTRLGSEYVFDNSASNPRNPSRTPEIVQWGWRTADEMADVWLQVTTGSEADRLALERAVRVKMQTEDAVGVEGLLRREPDHLALRNDAGSLFMTLGRPADALRHFEAVRTSTPESPPAWFNEGVALAALGRSDAAAASYRTAIRLDPRYAAARNNLGVILLRTGAVVDARDQFERAIEADPAHVDARVNLAMVLLGSGLPDRALPQVDAALDLDPGALHRLTPFAWLLATHPDPAVRRPAAAASLAGRIVAATNRRDVDALDALGAAEASLGRFEGAIRATTEALALEGLSEPVRANLSARLALYRRGVAFALPK